MLTLGTLSLFRWMEAVLPSLSYGRLLVRTLRKDGLNETELGEIIHEHHCTYATPSYHLEEEGKFFAHEMTIRTRHRKNFRELAESLAQMERILEFQITPSGD